ncbi:rRNA methylase [Nitzschia inconspicua]|uniref:rRNA methylase n=1 Tax=Nitzschia inconspicua TaxID=303405 RepID=A0A9K3K6M3_9STRA|nr:rRNA methylase [Nitzschia inconspicua]KAG7369330.1 rRNA methylase [Nitzschia inconspicua]
MLPLCSIVRTASGLVGNTIPISTTEHSIVVSPITGIYRTKFRRIHGRIYSRRFGGTAVDAETNNSTDDQPPSTNLMTRNAVKAILTTTSKQIQQTTDAASTASNQNNHPQLSIQNLLQGVIQRAYSTTQLVEQGIRDDETATTSNEAMEDSGANNDDTKINNKLPTFEFSFGTRYKHHPALNNVALAHALWASILRPNVDTAIDATCGNGHDSVKISELLFLPQQRNNQDNSYDNKDQSPIGCHSQLLCLDIQQQACDRTQQAVTNYLTSHQRSQYMDRVHVLQTTHEVLPRPVNATSVGLVVYNLGWLPAANVGPDDPNGGGKDCVTTMETTLASISDAALLLRLGGMISVVTYPATGPEEDRAVQLFLECLALLSSNTRTWQEAISSFVMASSNNSNSHNDRANNHSPNNIDDIAHHVTQAMQRVITNGPPNQTWRVSKHEKLGMDQAPVLLTATRIK